MYMYELLKHLTQRRFRAGNAYMLAAIANLRQITVFLSVAKEQAQSPLHRTKEAVVWPVPECLEPGSLTKK